MCYFSLSTGPLLNGVSANPSQRELQHVIQAENKPRSDSLIKSLKASLKPLLASEPLLLFIIGDFCPRHTDFRLAMLLDRYNFYCEIVHIQLEKGPI